MRESTAPPVYDKACLPFGQTGSRGLGDKHLEEAPLTSTHLGHVVDTSTAKVGPWEGGAAEPPTPLGLPCLLSEQLNNHNCKNTTPQKNRKIWVELEVQGMAIRHGVEKLGFLTLTFPDPVVTIKEASRRLNSLLTNELSRRYVEWLSVVQRHKDGKVHFHFVVVMAQDIRTGFNFEQVRRRDYSSASPYLKAEWKHLRAVLPYDEETGRGYGFGRHELLPVRVPDGFGRYIARYVAGNTKRQEGDRGARLVRFSKNFRRCVVGPFSPFTFTQNRVRERQQLLLSKWPSLEETARRGWMPSIRSWLSWLLWSAPAPYFESVLSRTEEDLTLYSGAAFALEENARAYREAFQEAQKRRKTLPSPTLSGAGVTPDRAKPVERRRLPGELFLARA